MKRSVRIGNHKTSISLEAEFWDELKVAAERDHVSLNQLIARIDNERAGNLSSALRLHVLKCLKKDAR